MVYRCDRKERRGGGVLLAISKDIPSSCIHISSNLETVWATVTLNNQKIILGVCYRPPSSPCSFIHDLHDVVSTITTKFHSTPLFLLGDFNFPNITWKDGQPILSSSSDSREFFGFCSTFSLCQMVTQATRITPNSFNTLDLILTNCPEYASETHYLPGISDHLIITFPVNVPFQKLPKSKKIIRDYKKAKFEEINKELCEFVDEFLKDFDKRTVQSNWDMFAAEVERLTNRHIPTRAIICNPRAPWYSNTLKRLSNRKKRLYRSAKQANTDCRWKLYTLASSAYVAALKHAKE